MERYCLIGRRLPHSFSKIIHNLLGLEYDLVELDTEADAVSFIKNNPYAGYNVTIPYKQTVMPHLDELDESAVKAGAVNTVVKKGGRSIGYNTDTSGMAAGLKKMGASLSGKKVMILGSGGTASMAVSLAKESKAKEITVVSRGGSVNYSNYHLRADTEILINCTPVGMYPENEGCPVDLCKLPALEYVFDAVYNPLSTRLVMEARARGITADGGLSMLVAQAIIAQNLFLGYQKFDTEAQTAITTAEILRRQSNIVLVGMPSSGKTSVGLALEKLTGKPFVDTDSLIIKEASMSVPEIFAKEGEAGFRAREKKAIRDCSRGFGKIIATGGGAILYPENRPELKQNSVVFWLQRDIGKLDTSGRPLSKDKNTLQAMEKIRYPLYNDIKDYIIDNNGGIDDCAQRVKDLFDAHFGN